MEGNPEHLPSPDKPKSKTAMLLAELFTHVRMENKEVIDLKDTFFAGDSYMVGIRSGDPKNLKGDSKVGRRFFALNPKDADTIESVTLKALKNPSFKQLVLDGGLNDFYSLGRDPEEIAAQIIKSYTKILQVAHEKRIPVILYTINEVTQSHPKYEAILNAIRLVNKWMKEESGAARVIDTNLVTGGKLAKDGLHPTAEGYKKLYQELLKASEK